MEADDILSQLNTFFSSFQTPEKGVVTPNVTSNTTKDQKPVVSDGSYQAPIKGTYACSGAFGHGDERHQGKHNGVDLRAPGGTSVYPIADGKVELVESWNKGGNIVTISHTNVKAYYAHLGTVSVKPGQTVNKNTVIGTIGDSGNAKGTVPHLHIETKVNGTIVNPSKFFFVPPYTNFDKSKEVAWISEEAKQKAKIFNVQEHKSAIAFVSDKMIKKYF